MAEIVVTGGGVCGLLTAMLLAGDGHTVTVLERDAAAPPEPTAAWDQWDRKGVNQFRMLHWFQPRWHSIVEAELPQVGPELDRAGALRLNMIDLAPADLTGGPQPGDEQLGVVTGRRPVVESAVARAAAATPGVTVRRGVVVDGLVARAGNGHGVPRVTGVRVADGEELTADLVVDATGRRSPLPGWLSAVGARTPYEELEDSGFVYYGRHFRSDDGSTPPPLGPLLMDHGSISALTLPADNGTWGVGIIARADDAALRGLKDNDRWMAALRSCLLVAHWADGEPLDDVAVMAKIEDRYRRFVVDGSPVATGVVAVADSWACTNPSVGRGASIGLVHAVALRDVLREQPLDDPAKFALAFDEATERTVAPWYRATLEYDHLRLGDMSAEIAGEPFDGGPSWDMTKALMIGSGRDPDVLRGFMRLAGVLTTPDELFAEPGMFEKVVAAGGDWRDAEPAPGPTRDELVAIATASPA